jgi:hypothetical protein
MSRTNFFLGLGLAIHAWCVVGYWKLLDFVESLK